MTKSALNILHRPSAFYSHVSNLVCILMSAGVVAVYFLTRTGLDSLPMAAGFKTVCLLAFVLLLPTFGAEIFSDGADIQRQNALECFFLLLMLSIFVLVPFLYDPSRAWMSMLVLILMGVSAVVLLIRTLKQCRIHTYKGFWLLIALWIVWAVGNAWGRGYHNPLFSESMLFNGADRDTIFHVATASMIQTYGVCATGLHGLIPFAYHYGSHWIFARLARFLVLPVADFYNFAYPALFIPLLLKSFQCAAQAFSSEGFLKETLAANALKPWAVLLIALVGIFPLEGKVGMIMPSGCIVLSESYTVAAFLFLLILGMAFGFYPTHTKTEWSHDVARRWAQSIFILIVPGILIWPLGMSKLSFVPVALALYAYSALRWGFWKRPAFLTSLVIGCAVAEKVFQRGAMEGMSRLGWFTFFKNYFTPTWYSWIPLILFFWVLVSIWLFVRRHSLDSFQELKSLIEKKTTFPLELVLLTALTTGLLASVVSLPSSAELYFLDISRIIAIVFVVSYAPYIFSEFKTAFPALAWSNGPMTFGAFKQVVCVLPLIVALLINLWVPTQAMLEASVGFRYRMLALMGEQGSASDDASAPVIQYQLLKDLQKMAKDPVSVRARRFIYIDPKTNAFWHGIGRGAFGTMAVPALSGSALLYGLPRENPFTPFYGFRSYVGVPISPKPNEDLCVQVKALGGDMLSVFLPKDEYSFIRHDVNCLSGSVMYAGTENPKSGHSEHP